MFIANLKAGNSFSPQLRVHKLANTEIWSLTFALDGQALFRYGDEVAPGERHIIWEAIGTHDEVYNFKSEPDAFARQSPTANSTLASGLDGANLSRILSDR